MCVTPNDCGMFFLNYETEIFVLMCSVCVSV